MTEHARTFIQARMSSRRFPGKVLAPFRGRPMIQSVIERAVNALPHVPVVLLTSTDPTDDPLCAFVEWLKIPCFRGPLDDVLERFRTCARAYPCEWILRLCADSPLLNADVLRFAFEQATKPWDVVTTTRPRTLPKGHNCELFRVGALETAASQPLTREEREHVTESFYRRGDTFRVLNVGATTSEFANHGLAIDSLEDWQRLSALDDRELARFSYDLRVIPGA